MLALFCLESWKNAPKPQERNSISLSEEKGVRNNFHVCRRRGEEVVVLGAIS
jgi:hypothetical protein